MAEAEDDKVVYMVTRLRPKVDKYNNEKRSLNLYQPVNSKLQVIDTSKHGLFQKSYDFYQVFGETEEPETVFLDGEGEVLVDLALDEEPMSTLFVGFGPATGGKSTTLFDYRRGQEGLAYQAIGQIFAELEDDVELHVQAVEYFCDTFFDVLNGSQPVSVNTRSEEVELRNVESVKITNELAAAAFLEKVSQHKRKDNSFFLLRIIITRPDPISPTVKISSSLYFLECVPPEPSSKSKKTQEIRFVSSTLDKLGCCIAAMNQGKLSIPTEGCLLTRYLEPALSGYSNCLFCLCLPPTDPCGAISLEFTRRLSHKNPSFSDILPEASRVRASSTASTSSLNSQFSSGSVPDEVNSDEIIRLEAELRVCMEVYGYSTQFDDHDVHNPQFERQITLIIKKLKTELARLENDRKRSVDSNLKLELDELREELKEEFDEYKQEYEREQENVLKKFRTDAQAKQEKLVHDFSEARRKFEDKIKDLKNQLRNQSSESNENEREHEHLRISLSKALKRVTELEDAVETMKSNRGEAQNQFNDEVEGLKKELRKKIAKLQKVEEELARLKKRMESSKADLKKKDKKIKKLQNELKKKESELKERLEELPPPPPPEESVQQVVNPELEAMYEDLQNQLEDEKKKREELEYVIMELRSKLPGDDWIDNDQIDDLGQNRVERNPEMLLRRGRDEEMEDEEYESAFGHQSTIDLYERIIEYVQNAGIIAIKFGRSGKPHLRYVHLNQDRTRLCWRDPKGDISDKGKDHYVELKDVTRIILGQHTEVFHRQAAIDPDQDERSLSLVVKGGTRTLDLVMESSYDFEAVAVACACLTSATPTFGAFLDLGPYPLSMSLEPDERELCEKWRVVPDHYLAVKELYVDRCWELGYLTIADARSISGLNLMVAEKIVELMESRRWICTRPLYEDEEPLIDPFDWE
ncbi:hypothetical protein PCE1_000465 [Barthelona sp. PCE]